MPAQAYGLYDDGLLAERQFQQIADFLLEVRWHILADMVLEPAHCKPNCLIVSIKKRSGSPELYSILGFHNSHELSCFIVGNGINAVFRHCN